MNGKKAKALRRAVRKISAGKPAMQYVGEKRFHSNGNRVSIQCKLDPVCTRAMVKALKFQYKLQKVNNHENRAVHLQRA